MNRSWFEVDDVAELESPALLIYRERVEANIDLMVRMADGNTGRLRPHVKTHKMGELVQWQLKRGLSQFKCATIAEAEMLGEACVAHVLLAYPLVGPNVGRFVRLIQKFSATRFACIIDNETSVLIVAEEANRARQSVEVFLDIDCGMHRTGIAPDRKALELYRRLASTPGLTLGGLHCYDGHIHQSDLSEREAACLSAFAPVWQLVEAIHAAQLPLPKIVAGGTPTYPIHLRDLRLECSPGTPLLWDFGYGDRYPDMPFLPAALLFSRVVSCPEPGIVCTDLGYKAVASEGPQPRVKFLNLPEAEPVMHSEEHLVMKVATGSEPAVGSALYGLPRHVCPTVALHDEAVQIQAGKAIGRIKVSSRNRHLTL